MTQPEPVGVVDFSNTEIAFLNKSDKQLKWTYLMYRMMNSPFMVKLTSSLALIGIKLHLPFTRKIIEKTIFNLFCGGKNLLDCQQSIDNLYKYKIYTVLDYGVEGKTREEDLDKTMQELLKAIEFAASNASVPIVSTKVSGLAKNEILELWQAGKLNTDKQKALFERIEARIDRVCKAADEYGVGIFIDAEESWIQGAIDYLVEKMMARYNKQKVVVYHTFQLYRHDRLGYLKSCYEKSRAEGYLLGAKLVRGAYMEKERDRAEDLDYPSPIQKDKESTDRDYNDAIRFCVERYETLASCNASHNLASCLLQAELIAEKDLPRSHPHLNFSQLYGMSDYISYNLAEAGYNVAKYLPYGPIREVIPYLIRRAQENTSVTGDMSRELRLISREMERRGLK